MSDHFNGLTPAEAERLAMLAEECGEVVQVVGKVLRHGYGSHHPDGGPDNRVALRYEIEDLRAVIAAMDRAGDVAPSPNDEGRWPRKLRYAHHQ